jgi:hypothetical protein
MKNEGKLSRAAYTFASVILSIILWVVISLLLMNGAMKVGDLISSGSFIHWERVDTPAGKISDLRLGESGEVLLAMDDGRLFDWNQRSWNEIEKPTGAGPLSMECKPGNHGGSYVKNSPFTPIKSVALDCFGPDIHEHFEFALSPANEVWMWDWATGDLSFYQYLPPLLGGLILSLICLLSLIVINIVMIRSKFHQK